MSEIRLMHGDCLEKMAEIESGSVDMVLTDPPYGTTACKWDSIIPLEPMWEQLKRVIKSNGVIVMTASQPFTTTLIASNMKMFKYCWVWDKVGGANFCNLKNRPLKTHEDVAVFAKSADFTFNPERVPRTEKSLKRYPAGKERLVKQGDNAAAALHYGIPSHKRTDTILSSDGLKHPIDIITFNRVEKGRYKVKHPTKKPVALMEYLIKTYTNEGDTVLDFTMGSGATGVACRNLGRSFIGIELNAKYFEIAKKRIEEANATLF